MKKLILVVAIIANIQLNAQFENLHFGTDSTLDVVSWNMEWFPKNGQATIDYVQEVITNMDAEVYAVQEIDNEASFESLMELLPNYESFHLVSDYLECAYIYKKDIMDNLSIYEILTDNFRELPRSPMVLEMDYMGEHYVIINVHLKCCGDGYLDMNDDWDEEKRRYDACILIEEYISTNHSTDKIVFLGDMNDILTDQDANNVFQMFTDDADNYWFADTFIAQGSSSDWSYPSWPSHIDHIMINSPLYDEFDTDGSVIETIKLDGYFEEGWEEYDYYISDHRPLGLKIKNISSLGETELSLNDEGLKIYPNPFTTKTTIDFNSTTKPAKLVIHNMYQQIVAEVELPTSQSEFIWDADDLGAGFYYISMIIDNRTITTKKLLKL